MKKIANIASLLIIGLFLSCNKNLNANFFQKALVYYHEKDFENSLSQIKKIGCLDNFYDNGQFLKAKILFFQQNYLESEKIFEKLWKKNLWYESFIWQIRSLVLSDSLAKAEKILLKEIKNGSTDWRIFYYLSKLYGKQNKIEESIMNLHYAEINLQESKKVYDDLLLFWNEVQVIEKVEKYKEKKKVLLQ